MEPAPTLNSLPCVSSMSALPDEICKESTWSLKLSLQRCNLLRDEDRLKEELGFLSIPCGFV